MLRRLAALAALLAFGTAADAQTHMRGYPSLAKRPIESRDDSAPSDSPIPAPLPPLDSALGADAARFASQGENGIAAFDKRLPTAQRSVAAASGARPASEAWSQAEIEISALDAARYDAVAALASLDTLYVDLMGKAGLVADPIVTYRQTLASAVDRQNDALDTLKARLAQP